MKAIKLILTALIVFGGLSSAVAFDNKSFVKGQITLQNGEIKHGYILKKDVVSNCQHVTFKDQNGEVQTYEANDLRGYVVANDVYISQQITNTNKKRVFMKQIHNGKTDLYVHYVEDNRIISKKPVDKQVYLHENDFHYAEDNVKYAFYVKHDRDSHFLRLHKKKFKSQLAEYFGHLESWDMVQSDDFHYNKVTHLIEYFNDRHVLKGPKF